MRRRCLRVSGGERFPPLPILPETMPKEEKILSVFVDESGTFRYPDATSRFYILALVFHDQRNDITPLVQALDESAARLGLDVETFACHAGPIIRREKEYVMMSRSLRARIFDRMLNFSRRADYRYRCVCVDQKYVSSEDQIVATIRRDLSDFLDARQAELKRFDKIKVYYDNGQSAVKNLLLQVFSSALGSEIEFAQNVKPLNYKMFQLADLICTLHLIEQKILHDLPMTESEYRFFGGMRQFRRYVLKQLKKKEI